MQHRTKPRTVASGLFRGGGAAVESIHIITSGQSTRLQKKKLIVHIDHPE
jgi:hypothetical protein